MIKIALSVALGAVIGAYAASSPMVHLSGRHEIANAGSIDPLDLTKQAKDLPALEVKDLF